MPFVPKTSTRLSPNVSLRLTDRCLDITTQMLTKVANERATIRNARDKKSIRKYMYENLPASLHPEILQKAIQLSLGAQSILNLLDLFEPAQDARYKVDLVGPSSFRIGCWRAGHIRWFIRPLTEYNLTVSQLEQLYNILIWSNPSQLREIALSTTSSSLKSSKIPNILARGRALTKVTLLECADNHILRILGLNCPCLKYLDVSHSRDVTAQGLYSLFLSRPPRKPENVRRFVNGNDSYEHARLPYITPNFYGDLSSYKKNSCAETIVFIKLLNTPLQVNYLGGAYVCGLLENAYKFLLWPTPEIVRIIEPEGVWEKAIKLNMETRRFPPCAGLSDEVITAVSSIAENMRDPWAQDNGHDRLLPTVMDSLLLPLRRPAEEQRSLLFIQTSLHCSVNVLRIHIKVEHTQFVTSIVSDLTCAFFLDQMGLQFPHLKYFRGLMTDVWSFDELLFPNLVVICAWCWESMTILSILQHAPSIRFCEFNILEEFADIDDNMKLNDSTLKNCLISNQRLSESLEELVIQPCWLTTSSLRALVKHCPNMKIIGDLQSWNIRSREIERFNKYLDKMGSQCVLSVMNLPQPRIMNFKWI